MCLSSTRFYSYAFLVTKISKSRENCNKKAAKALRQLYRRPYFIPHMVDLSDSNWVLISSDFKGKVYKEVCDGGSLVLQMNT